MIKYLISVISLTGIIYYFFSNSKMIKYKIKKSNIQGEGIIATNKINKKELIDIAIIESNDGIGHITPFGSKINHCSKNYNTILKKLGNNYYVMAKKNIKIGEELTISYDHKSIPPYIERSKIFYKVC